MSEQTNAPGGLGDGTDISAADLDVEGDQSVSPTSEPDAYDDEEGSLGGLGGADGTAGGAG